MYTGLQYSTVLHANVITVGSVGIVGMSCEVYAIPSWRVYARHHARYMRYRLGIVGISREVYAIPSCEVPSCAIPSCQVLRVEPPSDCFLPRLEPPWYKLVPFHSFLEFVQRHELTPHHLPVVVLHVAVSAHAHAKDAENDSVAQAEPRHCEELHRISEASEAVLMVVRGSLVAPVKLSNSWRFRAL